LIEGRGGVFEVTIEGRKIFSKERRGAFPREEEILACVREEQRREKGGSGPLSLEKEAGRSEGCRLGKSLRKS
jgi:hypothetical protein